MRATRRDALSRTTRALEREGALETPPEGSEAGPFRTLPLDARAERSVSALRLVAALATMGGAIWIALLAPPAKGWVCIAAGALASIMWVAMWGRARKTLGDAGAHRLVLDPDGLSVFEGNKGERRLAWTDVASIEADEDHLVVRVAPTQGEPLSIEPRYGGLGMYELEAALRAARSASG